MRSEARREHCNGVSTLSPSFYIIPDGWIGGYDSWWNPSLPSPSLGTLCEFQLTFFSSWMSSYIVSCILVIKQAIETQLPLRSIEQCERKKKQMISEPVNVTPCSWTVSSTVWFLYYTNPVLPSQSSDRTLLTVDMDKKDIQPGNPHRLAHETTCLPIVAIRMYNDIPAVFASCLTKGPFSSLALVYS